MINCTLARKYFSFVWQNSCSLFLGIILICKFPTAFHFNIFLGKYEHFRRFMFQSRAKFHRSFLQRLQQQIVLSRSSALKGGRSWAYTFGGILKRAVLNRMKLHKTSTKLPWQYNNVLAWRKWRPCYECKRRRYPFRGVEAGTTSSWKLEVKNGFAGSSHGESTNFYALSLFRVCPSCFAFLCWRLSYICY